MLEMKTLTFPDGKTYEVVDEKARNMVQVEDKPEIQIPTMEDLEKKSEKIQIDYTGNKVFKYGDATLNFKQIYDYHITKPDFTFIVYGNRAYLCSFIDIYSNPRQMRFESTINSDGKTKVSSIYLTSNDGVNITSTTVSDINSENSSNKVNEITDTNKNSTTHYPSNKAIVDYVSAAIEALKRELGQTT